MSSWDEERFDVRRPTSEDEECPCKGTLREPHVHLRDRTLMHWPGLRDLWKSVQPTAEEGEWHCHLCSDGGLTPWPPGTECPNYPCQAFKRPTESYIDHPQAD